MGLSHSPTANQALKLLDLFFMSASISDLARTENLLVISDFDGTLAGFSTDAYDVPVNQEAVSALRKLATLPNTTVAILSGRHLGGLIQVSGFSEQEFVLAGSHGAETSEDQGLLSPEQELLLSNVTAEFEGLIKDVPGAFVEHKPYHRVLHLIAVTDPDVQEKLMVDALALDIPGVKIKAGKNIAEASVTDITKGSWIAAALERYNATAAIFIGDDTTDEDGFAVLSERDMGVKVGDGETAASSRVPDIEAVGELLTELAQARQAATA